MTSPPPSAAITSEKANLEEGLAFSPKFDSHGLITCVTIEHSTSEVLMLAHMDDEALRLTIETGIVHYFSRSRQALWRKGDTSGQVQTLVTLLTDCDQDALVARVSVGGDGKACHTGRKSCFYRSVKRAENGVLALEFTQN